MRSLKLAKSGLNKLRAHQKELKQADIEDSLKSIPPGEWCVLTHSELPLLYVCFVNSLIDEKFSSVQVIRPLARTELELFHPVKEIQGLVTRAFQRRQKFKEYHNGSRIFYGVADGLPGLIIDQFFHRAVVQINTAGVDKYRLEIKQVIESLISGVAYFLDNPKYREKEFLPTFENESVPDLEIEENGIRFLVKSEVIQKVGFYFDHRENRSQFMRLLDKLNHNYKNGIDLFCYAGAWGLCALKSGIDHVDFVDQGDFAAVIESALKTNDIKGKGTYFRNDVFKFLDESFQKKNLYDVILCDPPAFAKSHNQKEQALEGYSKLHRKVFKVAAPGGLMAFSSCTHYVSHDEFQKNILDAANRENKKIQLLYAGIQGWDHPVTSLLDKTNYIKSYFYLMES